ncbi:MAG: hypothetical protein WCS17_00575 [Prevotella sp.]|jgi:hypothetical protein
MNNNESSIKRQYGKNQPFKVPEGYFDDFSKRLMAQLPAQKQNISVSYPCLSRVRLVFKYQIWRISLIAASVVAVFFSLNFIFFKKDMQPDQTAQKTVQKITVDQAADYAMMDNEDIYADLVDDNTH